MSLERIRLLVTRFRERVRTAEEKPAAKPVDLEPKVGRELLESMLLARHLDVAAHELRAEGRGHYTICSSGHETNVVLGRLTHVEDPTIVHYRSAALQIERARQVREVDAVLDIALSLVAAASEPLCSGRHKVFGNKRLGIIPQTSTIASHLPRSVGLAFALERRARLGLVAPTDAIALASFGDASINHSTALGAANAAGWTAHQNLKLPLLWVCEDNGLGVSVRSPVGWVEERLRSWPHFDYFSADGTSLVETYRAARAAVERCRARHRPVVLHLRCVRLLGHAGSDVDEAYRPAGEIEEALARDPVLMSALELIDGGALTRHDVLDLDRTAEARVADARTAARRSAGLDSRSAVMAAIAPRSSSPTAPAATIASPGAGSHPMTLAQGINAALAEALLERPEALIFGEDVAQKGGVYGVTRGLHERFGAKRVFNTLLDEQTILGLALGCASLGLVPIPEIQYLAYLHNAEDQLRGEASTMAFFSNGAYDNPMLVRIAGLAYQKGFGGHFHNDNSIAVLRDVPGITLVVPARADDALALYRAALALVRDERRVVVAVEPIALYHTRDLYDPGDGAWLASDPGAAARFGEVKCYGPNDPDLVVGTYGNGVVLSLRAAARLERESGIRCRVVDLRWLVPLPLEALLAQAEGPGRLLFVDECRGSGSVSEAVAAAVLERVPHVAFRRVTGADSFVPLGDAARLVLVSEEEIVAEARTLVGGD